MQSLLRTAIENVLIGTMMLSCAGVDSQAASGNAKDIIHAKTPSNPAQGDIARRNFSALFSQLESQPSVYNNPRFQINAFSRQKPNTALLAPEIADKINPHHALGYTVGLKSLQHAAALSAQAMS